jgi:hypothetical protein
MMSMMLASLQHDGADHAASPAPPPWLPPAERVAAGPITADGANARAELFAGLYDPPSCYAIMERERGAKRREAESADRIRKMRQMLKRNGMLPSGTECAADDASADTLARCEAADEILDPMYAEDDAAQDKVNDLLYQESQLRCPSWPRTGPASVPKAVAPTQVPFA